MRMWATFCIRSFPKAIFRVLFAVIFTFGPIALLSIPWTDGDLGPNATGFRDSFVQHWINGEILLPILGVSGAVLGTLILNRSMLPTLITAVLCLIAICVVAGSTFAISESDGFSLPLSDWLIHASYYCYAVMASIWVVVIAFDGTMEPQLRDSRAASDKIIQDAKKMRGGGENDR